VAKELRTLKFIRSLVRTEIREPVPQPGPYGFLDTEIDGIVSLCQWIVITKLKKINQAWVSTRDSIDLVASHDEYDIPSSILEMDIVKWKKEVTKMPLEELQLLDSGIYTPTMDDPYYWHTASKIYIRPIPSAGDIASYPKLWIYGPEKPTQLTSDEQETILDERFLELLIQCAKVKCAPKKDFLDVVKEEALLNKKYLDIAKKSKDDIRASVPGTKK